MGKKNKLFSTLQYCHGCLINPNGDISRVYGRDNPPAMTRSAEEYIRDHAGMAKACSALGKGTLFHWQDRFYEQNYSASGREGPPDAVQQARDRHFNGRPYLKHQSLVIITATGGSLGEPLKMIKTVTGKNLIPITARDGTQLRVFKDETDQTQLILQHESGIGCWLLPGEDLMGTKKTMGVTELNGLFSPPGSLRVTQDIDNRDGLRFGDLYIAILDIGDASLLPPQCCPITRNDALSTDKTFFPVQTGAVFGRSLPCPHIYNEYMINEDRAASLKDLDKKLKRHESLGPRDSTNLATLTDLRAYREAVAKGEQTPVRMYANLILWASSKEELAAKQHLAVAKASEIGVDLHLETLDPLPLLAAAIPGNAGELPISHTFPTFAEQACCFAVTESWEKDCPGPSSIPLVDRATGIPIQVDFYEYAKRKGWINTYNKIIYGPSGTGKSVFMQMLLLAIFGQGHHVLVGDIGGSYKRLCQYLGGRYFAFEEDQALSFNPFLLGDGEVLDTEKMESLVTLLMILWKTGNQTHSRTEYITVSNILTGYYAWLKENTTVFPCFDTLFDWMQEHYIPGLKASGIRSTNFDWTNFLFVLRPYYRGGQYEHLLNAKENLNLLQERFVVFELDRIKGAHEMVA